MSRGGYRLFCVLCIALGAVGAWLVLPRPGELFPTEVRCADWHARPVTGHVRIVGCAVDARFPTYHHVGARGEDALVSVWPTRDAEARFEAPALVVFTEDPETLSVVDRVHAFDADRARRFAERHEAALLRVRDLEGEIGPPSLEQAELVALDDTLDSGVLVLDETRRAPYLHPVGAALLLTALLLLAVITRKQRQWIRARERATGTAQPVAF